MEAIRRLLRKARSRFRNKVSQISMMAERHITKDTTNIVSRAAEKSGRALEEDQISRRKYRGFDKIQWRT